MDTKNIIKDLENKSNSKVGVLDKIVKILSSISKKDSNLSEIMEETKLPRATTHRLLLALEHHHLITHTKQGYSLGSQLIEWSESSKLSMLIKITRPILINLCHVTNESTQLYMREGNDRVCLISIEPKEGLKNTVPVGARLPLNVGSAGKIISAWENLEIDVTEKEEILKQGWAQSIAERENGVASVSAPILKNKGLLGVISISGPISRLGEEPGKVMSDYLIKATKEIKSLLEQY